MKRTIRFGTVLMFFLALCACGSIRYVPVESVRHDSIYISSSNRDSIHVHDSIYIHERGDTVFTYRYRYLFAERQHTDTLYLERTDTLHVPVMVEKQLTGWQRAKLELGGWAFGALALVALALLGRIVYNRYGKTRL